MSHGANQKGGRPWVCCVKCHAKSWVYTDLGIRNCKFCRSPFPVGPKGSEYEGSDPIPRPGGKGGDFEAAIQLLLKSDRCVSYKDALLGMSREVCPPQPKKPGAIITAASQRVCRAVRERGTAKAKLDKVPAIMQSMVEELSKFRDSIPSLRADLEAAETELAIASAENDKVLQQAQVPVVQIQIPEGMGEEATAFVYDITAQIESLSKQLAVLCSPSASSSNLQQPRQQQQHEGGHDKQQQHEGQHDKQGREASASEVAGGRWRASVSPNPNLGVSRDDLSDSSPEMPVDEVATRKRVIFDPYADGAGDMHMPAPDREVVSVGSDEDEWIPLIFSHHPGSDDPDPLSDAIFGGFEGEHGSERPTQEADLEDPVARAEILLSEVQQMAEMLSFRFLLMLRVLLILARGRPAGLVGSMGVDPSTTGRVVGPRTNRLGVDPSAIGLGVDPKTTCVESGELDPRPLGRGPCASFILTSPDGAFRLRDFVLAPFLRF